MTPAAPVPPPGRREGPGDGVREVVVTDLEMLAPGQLRAAGAPRLDADLVLARRPAPEFSRFLYRAVGGDWYWLDRLDWTLEQWRAWVGDPGYVLHSAWVDGVPAGYVELLSVPRPDAAAADVEIAYFGLLPGFAGHGLGGWLLTRAVEAAWALPGTARVWLHTCELDSPAALGNYRARGFEPCGTSTEWWDTRAPSPGPWRGSRGEE